MKQIFSFRKNAFWLIDFLLGNKVKKHLQEITLILENPNDERSLKLKNKNLKMLLEHASNTTPYYSNFKNIDNIESFKVLKKTDIQENFDAFKSNKYIGKNNYKVSTSGSTGVPFFLFQDKNKRNRNRADVIHFLKRCNFNIGDRLYQLEVWRGHNKKGAIKSWSQNVVQFDISSLTDERILEFLDLIRKDSNISKTLLGFASSFEMISQFLEDKDIKIEDVNLNSIIANSEYLNPYTKTTMCKYFNTAVLSRYSSEEIGIMAHNTIDSPNNFVVNHASYYIELLSLNNDNPVKSGEYGRIVVTDLFNYAMPMIRYDTGDIAKLIILDNGNIEFEQIEGRKMDLVYDSQGNIISSFVIYTKFYKYYDLLKQYQFIQQAEKDYEVKLNLKGNNFSFENELIENIKNDFGRDTNVIITYIDEIPPLASGKRRKVVNNYVKTKSN